MAGEQQEDTTGTSGPMPGTDMKTMAVSPYQTTKGIKFYGADDKEAFDYAVAEGSIFLGPSAAAAAGQRGSRTQFSQNAVYGNVLFDADGYVVRPFYDPTDSAQVEAQMMKMTPEDLVVLATQMKSRGFYLNDDPSGLLLNKRGYSNTDINAFSRLMRFANSQKLIIQAMGPYLASLSPIMIGDGTTVKVTAEDDIKYYLDQSALSKLGRKLSKKDIDDAVAAIQANERKMASASRSSPSVAVAANIAAQKASPQEAASYQLGNAISLAFQTLGGG